MSPTDDRRSPVRGAHATEGELHTFLDGALDVLEPRRAREVREHADRCPGCRDRLAIESAVRDRSVGLLGADDPLADAPVPTFAELRHRAGTATEPTEPSAAGSGAGRRSLAWVATVVLSLGVGWGVGVFGPDGMRPAAVPVPMPSVPSAPASPPALPPEVDDGPPRPAAAEARDEESPGAPPPGGDAGEGDGLQPDPEPDPEPAPDPALAAAFRAALASDDSASAIEVPGEDEILARLGAVAVEGSVPAVRILADSLRERSTVGQSLGPGSLRSRVLPRSASPTGSGAVRVPSPPGAFLADRPADADAEAGQGQIALVLPGLELDEVRVARVWGDQEGVLVLQRLVDGRVVELRVAGSPVGGDASATEPPAVRPDAPSGWNRAVRRVDGGWLALDGPLSVEVLEQLLATAG